jgi:BlaI family penicillinase repressor
LGNQQLSPAEWDIMHALWDAKKATVNQMVDRLADEKMWHPKTIRTMLNRLVKKDVVHRSTNDGTIEYYPLLTKEDCIGRASDQFIDRVFDGALAPMVAHFVQQRPLTPEDKAELKRILDEEPDHE